MTGGGGGGGVGQTAPAGTVVPSGHIVGGGGGGSGQGVVAGIWEPSGQVCIGGGGGAGGGAGVQAAMAAAAEKMIARRFMIISSASFRSDNDRAAPAFRRNLKLAKGDEPPSGRDHHRRSELRDGIELLREAVGKADAAM